MTRAFDFTILSVIYIVAVVIHLMAVELMAPGTVLYELETEFELEAETRRELFGLPDMDSDGGDGGFGAFLGERGERVTDFIDPLTGRRLE